MSKHGGGTRDTQHNTTTQSIDADTQGRLGQIWQQATLAGGAGPSSLVTDAAGFNTGAQTAGANGLAALGGDPNAARAFMNPYQQQVVDAANRQWNQADQQSLAAVGDQATRAGAFGGSRHGVAEGVALGQNNMNREAQIAGLLSSGFDSSMNRAAQAAGFGAAGANANANLGLAGVGNPAQWFLNMLNQGYHGAQGQTTASNGASAHTEASGGFKIPFFG